jgi:N-acetylglucosamine-6-phosphate deacetylase
MKPFGYIPRSLPRNDGKGDDTPLLAAGESMPVDLHTHGIGGYDTKTSVPGDILAMAAAHWKQGVFAIVPTIYPSPIERMRQEMATIREAIEMQKAGFSTVEGARILGVHLEGPFLNPARSGALDPSGFSRPTEYNLDRLLDGFEDLVKIMTVAPELEGALPLIRTLSERDIAANMGHSDASYSDAEAGFQAGARGITHLFNAMRGIHHRDPGIAGFGLIQEEVYVEIIGDPFHLHPKILQLIFRVKDPGRIIMVSDSIKHTGTTLSASECFGPSGVPRGGTMTIKEALKRVAGLGISEELVMDSICRNPLEYLSAAGVDCPWHRL